MSIEVASCSDKGLVREVNEDSLAAMPDYGLVIVADGMGGYNAGDVASQIAVETIAMTLLPQLGMEAEISLADTVAAANDTIIASIEAEPQYRGMATTVVLGVFGAGTLHYAHVGDSRLYRLRGGQLEQLTRDHSMIQELVDQGMFDSLEEAQEAGVHNNVLTRGLGIDEQVEIDTAETGIEEGDLYLFCSDGLSNMVTVQTMEEVLGSTADSIDSAAQKLLAIALENGGTDNISLVLVRPLFDGLAQDE
ncbi:MAG: Stp1/IreP family PP2C-type Ser/Thr phosphatase [Sedimenticola sp.]